MVLLDANVILRYLLNDDEQAADKAEQLIASGDASVTVEVMAEVVYVLKGVYSLDRRIIAETLCQFMPLVASREHDVLLCALRTYGNNNLDFVDCVLLAYHKVRQAQIATFDHKLLKQLSSV